MKKTVLFVTILIGYIVAAPVYSAPVYYTFEGSVEWMTEQHDVLDSLNVEIGQRVTHTILVDYDAQGTKTSFEGNTVNVEGSFYTEYISGSALTSPNPYYSVNNMPNYTANFNYGSESIFPNDPSYNRTTYNFQSSNDHMYLFIQKEIFEIQIGDIFEFNNNITTEEYGDRSQGIWGHVSLTGISSTNPAVDPVPEPSTMILFGTGLVGAAGFMIRRRREY